MMNNDNEVTFRFLRAHGISLGLVFTVLLQLIGFVIWLTKQGEAVARLQEDHAEMTRRIDMLDQAGPRPTQLIQQRILTVEAANAAQDARLRELETGVSEIHRQVVENRIWIDQIVAAVRSFSHNYLPPPRGQKDSFRMQGDTERAGAPQERGQ
jgi:uncharacterized coiled-coil protein SlyX